MSFNNFFIYYFMVEGFNLTGKLVSLLYRDFVLAHCIRGQFFTVYVFKSLTAIAFPARSACPSFICAALLPLYFLVICMTMGTIIICWMRTPYCSLRALSLS